MYNSTMCSRRYHRGSSLTQDDRRQQIAGFNMEKRGVVKGIALQMRKYTEKKVHTSKKEKKEPVIKSSKS